jgi:hypothetical protein
MGEPLKRKVGFCSRNSAKKWRISMIRRYRFLSALVITVFAIFASVSAQELRDRELKPAFDFTTIQMPVEIVSIRLNGKAIQPGQKIRGDDDWLQGLSFTLKNISDKAIAYVAVSLRFTKPRRAVGFTLSYGVDRSRGEPRQAWSPPSLQPGQRVDLTLTKERYPNFLYILSFGGDMPSLDVVPYLIERVSFDDDPDVIWEGGYLKRRNPASIGKFHIIERYVLAVKH